MDELSQPADPRELGRLEVAAPCKADWEQMTGDDRVRFCGLCSKNVYNLSAMTTLEARELIIEKEGQLCVRFYQRPDGTVLTSDCPEGLARRRRSRAVGVAAAASLLGVGTALAAPALLELSSSDVGPPPAVPLTHLAPPPGPPVVSAPKPEPKPDDTAWIEQRRSQFTTSHRMEYPHVMGGLSLRIQDVKVIKPATTPEEQKAIDDLLPEAAAARKP